jgi:hypothetical protein
MRPVGLERTDRFVISKRPYAVRLDAFRPRGAGLVAAEAVWFQRKNGTTGACLGVLWGSVYEYDEMPSVRTWLDGLDTRYGGDCWARWNGTDLWAPGDWTAAQERQAFLEKMLDAYPAIPEGYDGWWVARR